MCDFLNRALPQPARWTVLSFVMVMEKCGIFWQKKIVHLYCFWEKITIDYYEKKGI
jgi:hypothetical protein